MENDRYFFLNLLLRIFKRLSFTCGLTIWTTDPTDNPSKARTFDTCCISQLRPVSSFDFADASRYGILDLVFLS